MLFLLFALDRDNKNDYAREDTVNSNFLQRDVSNGFQNVNSNICGVDKSVLNAQYNIRSKIDQANFDNQRCCCETQKEILENRYAAALQAQNMQAHLDNCCCDLKTAIHAEGEATRELIQSNTMQDLRDKINERDRELQSAQFQISQVAQTNTITNTLRPFPQPAYITCSPYQTYGYNNSCNGCCF